MNTLLHEFEDYCRTPGINSGKAGAYAKAIQYLCDFLGENSIDENVIKRMKGIVAELSLPDSLLYKDLLAFLDKRRQSSYLRKGFIKAALPYLFDFWSDRRLDK